jgi:hypothetical protein
MQRLDALSGLLGRLHGEHGFAVDDRGRGVGLPCLFCQAHHAALFWPMKKLLHQGRSVFVTLDRRIAGRLFVEDQSSRFAEAGSKLDDCIGGADVQCLDHPARQLSPTRTQDPLSQPNEQPVPGIFSVLSASPGIGVVSEAIIGFLSGFFRQIACWERRSWSS